MRVVKSVNLALSSSGNSNDAQKRPRDPKIAGPSSLIAVPFLSRTARALLVDLGQLVASHRQSERQAKAR